jgi:hypothetical protein
MKIPPTILGACAAAPLLGALIGSSINAQPLMKPLRSDAPAEAEQIAQYRPDTGYEAREVYQPAQDQYALVTRDGVIPVGELHMRGVRQDRSIDLPRYYYDDNAYEDEPAHKPAVAKRAPAIERAASEAVRVAKAAEAAATSPEPSTAPLEPVSDRPATLEPVSIEADEAPIQPVAS